jgi:hypothetical protein
MVFLRFPHCSAIFFQSVSKADNVLGVTPHTWNPGFMPAEQSQGPVYYRVDIGQEFPDQRENPDVPRWEVLVEVPDDVRRGVKGSLQWHAMELARTAIGKLRAANDPYFQPHARQAQRVDFDAIREGHPERDFAFPDFITDDECRVWFLKKPHSELP